MEKLNSVIVKTKLPVSFWKLNSLRLKKLTSNFTTVGRNDYGEKCFNFNINIQLRGDTLFCNGKMENWWC